MKFQGKKSCESLYLYFLHPASLHLWLISQHSFHTAADGFRILHLCFQLDILGIQGLLFGGEGGVFLLPFNTGFKYRWAASYKAMYQLHVFLDDATYKKMQNSQRQTGLSRSSYIRSLIVGQEIKPRPPDEWPELVRQVSCIARNINQLTRLANANKQIDQQTLMEVQQQLAVIWQRVKNL